MALGFIVVKVDENNVPTEFWNGTAFEAEIDVADFVATKPEARFLQGSLQAQDTSVDIVFKAAETNVTLV